MFLNLVFKTDKFGVGSLVLSFFPAWGFLPSLALVCTPQPLLSGQTREGNRKTDKSLDFTFIKRNGSLEVREHLSVFFPY